MIFVLAGEHLVATGCPRQITRACFRELYGRDRNRKRKVSCTHSLNNFFTYYTRQFRRSIRFFFLLYDYLYGRISNDNFFWHLFIWRVIVKSNGLLITKVSHAESIFLQHFITWRGLKFKVRKEKSTPSERECLILSSSYEKKKNDIVGRYLVIIKLKNIGKQCVTLYLYTLSLIDQLQTIYILNFLTIALCKYVSFSTIVRLMQCEKKESFCFQVTMNMKYNR